MQRKKNIINDKNVDLLSEMYFARYSLSLYYKAPIPFRGKVYLKKKERKLVYALEKLNHKFNNF